MGHIMGWLVVRGNHDGLNSRKSALAAARPEIRRLERTLVLVAGVNA